MKFFTKLIRDEDGATAIEYGLIAALIAVAAITAMQGIGSELTTTFSTVSTKMAEGNGAGGGGAGDPPADPPAAE